MTARRRAGRSRRRLGALVLASTLTTAVAWARADRAPARGVDGLDPALRAGVRVSVKGRPAADGVLLAEEIEIQGSGDRDEELQGPIEQLDAGAGTFRLLGRLVRLEQDTRFTREPSSSAARDDLRDGMRIKVDGETSRDGVLRAEKVRIARNQQHRERVKVEGPIEELGPSRRGVARMHVAGLPIELLRGTELIGARGIARPLVRRLGGVADDDELLFTRDTRFGRRVSVAGELRLRGEHLDNPDLDDETDDSELVPELAAQIGFAADLGPASAYLTFVGSREFVVRAEDSFETGDRTARVGEAYFQLPLGRRVAVAVGRQRFNEEREWHYNSRNLDVVRLFADLHPVHVEVSVGRDLFDETRNPREQDLTNRIVQARYGATRDLELQAFFVDRRDRTGHGDSPRTVGLRLLGDPGRRVELWLDLARQSGTYCSRVRIGDGGEPFDSGRPCTRKEPDGGFNVRRVRGWAVDGGLTFRPRIRLDPTFTVAYARASGENDDVRAHDLEQAAATTATSFRQTGLQRNRWKFNGVVSFRYYGEVLDPELTNLAVWTVGLGLRPARGASLDLVYHRYDQDQPSRSFHELEIDETPDGVSAEIGEEWDVVFGYEPTRRYEVRLTAGRFDPGPAFGPSASTASVVRFQTKFRF